MEYRVVESIFQNKNWKTLQLLKEGHDRMYDRDQITLDNDVIIFNTDSSVLFYDIKDIEGIQIFYLSVEEILAKVQKEMIESTERND